MRFQFKKFLYKSHHTVSPSVNLPSLTVKRMRKRDVAKSIKLFVLRKITTQKNISIELYIPIETLKSPYRQKR